MRAAHLNRANLTGANLEGAELEGVDLEDANLQGANLARAYLGFAYLVGANLEGAQLDETDLTGVYRTIPAGPAWEQLRLRGVSGTHSSVTPPHVARHFGNALEQGCSRNRRRRLGAWAKNESGLVPKLLPGLSHRCLRLRLGRRYTRSAPGTSAASSASSTSGLKGLPRNAVAPTA